MFDVIIDTREQQPWEIAHKDIGKCIHQKLDTGDYSIRGKEHIVTIDRKKSVSEIARNIHEERFTDELIRMTDIQHSYLLLEFSVDDINSYPVGSEIPKSKWGDIRTKGNFILSWLMRVSVTYGVHIVFAGNRENAQDLAIRILRMADK